MKKTRHLGNQGGLKHTLRGSGTIKKTTLKGDKFEFAEKLREKKNYILFVSGMGHETKEIEEVDDFISQSPPTEEIIEERQIIDNYQYYETKNCKKKPKKLYTTHHERLSIPFERTTLKKYSSLTSQTHPKSFSKYKTIKTSRFGKTLDVEEMPSYSSLTVKLRNKSYTPTHLYKTYKPNKNTSFTKAEAKTTTKKVIAKGKNLPSLSTINIYKSKNMIQMGKDKRIFSPTNLMKYKPNQNTKKYKPERTFTPNFGEKQTRTETKKGGEYLIKITTSRKPINEPKPYKMFDESKPRDKTGKLIIQRRYTPEYISRSGSEPRGRGDYDIDNFRQRTGEKPRSGSRPGDRLSSYDGTYRPKTGDKPGTYGRPQGPKYGDKPKPYGSPLPGDIQRPYGGPKQGDKPRNYGSPRPGDLPKSYGGPHGPKQGVKSGPYGGPHGPKPGNMQKPYGGPHGPGPYGGPHGPKLYYKEKPYGQKPINNQELYRQPHGPKPIDRAEPCGGPKPSVRQISTDRSKSFDRQNSPSFGVSHRLRPTIGHGLKGPNDYNQNTSKINISKESPKFNDRTFAGKRDRLNVGKPIYYNKAFPSKRTESHSREDDILYDRKYKPSLKYKTLTENNFTFSSKNLGQRPQLAFQSIKRPSVGDDNYNYYEFKHVIKQGRLNLPITIHHRRGEDDDSSQQYQVNSSYKIMPQNFKSNLTKRYHRNSNLQTNNKYNIRKDSKNQKLIYRKETDLTTNSIVRRRNNNNLTPDAKKGREIKPVSLYQKFGQKNKLNYNNVRSQINQSTEVTSNFTSKYLYNDDDDLVVINCPVHGKRTVRKGKLRELGIIIN